MAHDEERRKPAGRGDLCAVVAVGGSAGSIEPLQALLAGHEADGASAYVVLQHLDPRQPSSLAELLGRSCRVPVAPIEDGEALRPDRVYVLPPGRALTVDAARLHLTPVRGDGASNGLINAFLVSLARDQGEHAVGVLLSGAGTDGVLGLLAIRRHGGLALVQAPESARFDSMPRSAVQGGVVDEVLDVERIPQRLARHVAHLVRMRECGPGQRIEEQIGASLDAICAALRESTGHDFSRYKRSTLVRRVQRRMNVGGSETVAGFLELLRSSRAEAERLLQDLLIGVTRFFRDPSAFEALDRLVLGPLLEGRGEGEPLRVWVAGCATGEEAYSLAMLVAERLRDVEAPPPVKIVASDIDQHALDVARRGSYPASIAEDVPPELLERHFVREGEGYKVTKELREMCVFSLHSLVRDPPYSRMDLVACRNLLIYLDAHQQRELLPLLHFALAPGRFLFLGPTEGCGKDGELFSAVDAGARIFRKLPSAAARHAPFESLLGRARARLEQRPVQGLWTTQEQGLARALDRDLLERYAPACVLVDSGGNALLFSGPTGRYLEQPRGKPTAQLALLARKGLRAALRGVLQRAAAEEREVVQDGVRVYGEGERRVVRLVARPFEAARPSESLYLVLFEERGLPESLPAEVHAPAEDAAPDLEQQIQHLEAELGATREHLRASLDQVESSNEELTSSNEELLSMNEELQSANEELETSQEELRSLNQELEDLNEELHSRVSELDALNADLSNLFRSTGIAILFLDGELRVQRFTPDARELFRLIEADLGRSLADIAGRVPAADLAADVQQVLATGEATEREQLVAETGRWYSQRVQPYMGPDGLPGGAVVAFVDTTDLKEAQARQGELAQLVQASNDAIVGLDRDGTIRSWNPAAERMYGYAATEAIGRSIDIIVPEALRADLREIWRRVAEGEHVPSFRAERLQRGGRRVIVDLTISCVRDAAGRVTGFSVIQRDVTERERAAAALRESEQRFRLLADAAPVKIWMAGPDAQRTYFNRRWLAFTGRDMEQELGAGWIESVHPDDLARCLAVYEGAFERREPYAMDYRMRRHDGAWRWLLDHGVPRADGQEDFGGFIGSSLDITDRKRAEEELARSAAELARSNEELEQYAYMASHDLQEPLRMVRSYTQLLGQRYGERFDARGREFLGYVNEGVARMQELIRSLLQLSQVRVEPEQLVEVPLDEALDEALANLQVALEESGARVERQALPRVRGVPTLLMQLFQNLVANAVKFRSDAPPRIRVEVERLPQAWQVTVADNGIGIRPEYSERVFGMFQRLHSRARYPGTGVGLAICKKIVDQHGGRIWVDPAPEGGSAFRFTLPVEEPRGGPPANGEHERSPD